MSRGLEVLILLAVCGAAFFTGLGRHDYVKTEGLRAVVVEEMLERDGLSMPTVHGEPYLKKPPLYAWTTTLLARAVGRFDEQIARLPSAVCGTLLVLLIYGLGERWIGRGSGFCAAVMLLWCPTIVDYSVRAELDMPFSFFSIAAIACTLCALTPKGARVAAAGEAQPEVSNQHEVQPSRRGKENTHSTFVHAQSFSSPTWAWPAAYSFALIASMWKGPHSLIFMWLVMIGHGFATKRWAFLRSTSQWISLAVVLAVLIWWTKALSEFAGPSTVGRTAAIELMARLLPHRVAHILFTFAFPLELAAMTAIPAAFAIFSLHPGARRAIGLDHDDHLDAGNVFHRAVANCRSWWRAFSRQPGFLQLAAWLAPLLVFMAIAPAKAARYSIPIFPPIVLLAAAVCTALEGGQAGDPISRAYRRVWRIIFVVIGVVGVAALARWVAGTLVPVFRFPESERGLRWLILGGGCVLAACADLFSRKNPSLNHRLLWLLAVLVVAQPMLQLELWPRREATDSQRAAASQLDDAVPSHETIYVLGKHEFPDTQIYSAHDFRFVDSMDAALSAGGGDRAYCIVRIDDVEDMPESASARHREVLRFTRAEKENLLIEVTPK